MQKLSTILSEQKQINTILSITSKEQFANYVHEKLSHSQNYSEDACNMIIENLLQAYPDDLQKAISELENFQMHG